MKQWIFAAASAATLAACSTPPPPPMAVLPSAPKAVTDIPYQWTLGNAPKAHQDMVAEFGKAGLKPGQYFWAGTIPTEGDTRVIIDRMTQMAYVYRGDKLVGISTVSTARQGYITPLGEWKILEKRPFYRSKKYNNAPMPWMERIDEYGIALHGGGTPGHPESHGCIHLPTKFAERLYGLTKIGTSVIIEG